MKRSLPTFDEVAAPHAAARRKSKLLTFALALVLLASLAAAVPTGIGVRAQRGEPTPTPTATPTPEPDEDRDGVADREDLCPRTPAGARALQSGCAAVEIAVRPGVILRPLAEQLEAREAELSPLREFATAARGVGEARSLINASGAELRGGQLCQAAATFDRAVGSLRDAKSSLDGSAARLTAQLSAAAARADDTQSEHVTMILIGSHQEQLAASLNSALGTGRTLGGICATSTGGWEARGRVAALDDAARIVKLDNGQVLGLPPDRRFPSANEGGEILAGGIVFNDGTGLALDLTTQEPTWTPPPNPADMCLYMRIAPVQKLQAPYVLHHPEAYEQQPGTLKLEEGVRIGVHDFGTCDKDAGAPWEYRYSLAVKVSQSGVMTDLAYELFGGDTPVPLPDTLVTGQPFTIYATVQATKCMPQPTGFDQCLAPKSLWVYTYPAVMAERGFYGSANYDQTIFNVEDNGVVGDFKTATVTGLVIPQADPNITHSFEAEGYTVTNGQSSHPQLGLVKQGDEFAVHEWGGSLLVDDPLRRHGLQWARITGKRNDKTFWYSATLPRVIRDRVVGCPGAPDTFYKLPFVGQVPGVWDFGKGNHDDPIAGHGQSQFFAYDFGAPLDTEIRAARGGTVFKVKEDESKNSADYDICTDEEIENMTDAQILQQCPDNGAVGNYVWILHEDGTIASYNHLVQNGAEVQVNQRVHRGDLVGKVGNTGFSSDPHLHFEVVEKFLKYKLPPFYMPVAGPSAPSFFKLRMTATNQVVCGHVPRVNEQFESVP